MKLATPFKRLARAIGRPLWRRLKPRIIALIRSDEYLEQRFSALGARADSADHRLTTMHLQTNHVPVLDRKVVALEALTAVMKLETDHVPVLNRLFASLNAEVSALQSLTARMKLETDHVPVLNQLFASLNAQVEAIAAFRAQFDDLTSIIDFRLDQQRRDVEQKLAGELYIVRQGTHDAHAHLESLSRQLTVLKNDGASGPSGGLNQQVADIRAAVTKLETQLEQLAQVSAVVGSLKAQHEQLGQLGTSVANLEANQSQVSSRIASLLEETEATHFEQSKLAQDWVIEEWKYLSPMDVTGKRFTRLGRKGDGGYVMIDDLDKVQTVLSFGVGTEISWDLELAERGINVFMYDHTIEDIPAHHPNIKFSQFGLAGREDADNRTRPLSQFVEEERISTSENNILKIDVEGSEWEALRDIDAESLEPFSQILLELHGMADYLDHHSHLNRMYILKRLHQTHQVVHLHANNWRPCKIIGGAVVPDVVEVTLASRRRYSFSACTRTFPTALDYPNNADRADILFTLPASGMSGAKNAQSKMQ